MLNDGFCSTHLECDTQWEHSAVKGTRRRISGSALSLAIAARCAEAGLSLSVLFSMKKRAAMLDVSPQVLLGGKSATAVEQRRCGCRGATGYSHCPRPSDVPIGSAPPSGVAPSCNISRLVMEVILSGISTTCGFQETSVAVS